VPSGRSRTARKFCSDRPENRHALVFLLSYVACFEETRPTRRRACRVALPVTLRSPSRIAQLFGRSRISFLRPATAFCGESRWLQAPFDPEQPNGGSIARGHWWRSTCQSSADGEMGLMADVALKAGGANANPDWGAQGKAVWKAGPVGRPGWHHAPHICDPACDPAEPGLFVELYRIARQCPVCSWAQAVPPR